MAEEQHPPESLKLCRRTDRPDFCCAVPERLPVPLFIRDPRWKFSGMLEPEALAPTGFRERAARAALRMRGFYPFDHMH